MKIARSLSALPPLHSSSAVAIGNFDGIHLGHRKIITSLVEQAQAENLLSLVLTFSPHPGKMTGKGRIRLLHTEEQKLDHFAALGVEMVLIVPFDQEFSQLSSRDFFEHIVLSRLRAEVIIVGNNFRFGRNRGGNLQTLRKMAEPNQVRVHPVPPVTVKNEVVSSSLIRELILRGEIQKANTFLGEPYEIRGEVIPGKARGKSLGFPTANLKTRNEILPTGVFITLAATGREEFPSVTNIGTRPTFGQKSLQIETHVLDVEIDFYGRRLDLHFLKKIRDEIKFESSRALVAQIRSDIIEARRFFNP